MAHHAVLIVDVLGVTRRINEMPPVEPDDESPLQLRQLWTTLNEIESIAPREALHDAIALREDLIKLFALGYASLAHRAQADDLYWRLILRAAAEPG